MIYRSFPYCIKSSVKNFHRCSLIFTTVTIFVQNNSYKYSRCLNFFNKLKIKFVTTNHRYKTENNVNIPVIRDYLTLHQTEMVQN